jgi:hypothetical protein
MDGAASVLAAADKAAFDTSLPLIAALPALLMALAIFVLLAIIHLSSFLQV